MFAFNLNCKPSMHVMLSRLEPFSADRPADGIIFTCFLYHQWNYSSINTAEIFPENYLWCVIYRFAHNILLLLLSYYCDLRHAMPYFLFLNCSFPTRIIFCYGKRVRDWFLFFESLFHKLRLCKALKWKASGVRN